MERPTDERGEGGWKAVLSNPALRIPLVCAAATLVAAVVFIPYRIAEGGYLSYVTGAWAALADDVAHGVLYRPVFSALGYGGTRYFPLHFVLHGGLVWLGIPIRTAGHLLQIVALGMLIGGGALGTRRAGAPLAIAIATGILTIAHRTAFMGAAGIRGDLLPVALGVLGLALLSDDRERGWIASGVVLSLAVLAKPTLVWAPAGAALSLLSRRRIGDLVRLTVLVAMTTGAGLGGSILWSHGEMIASFRACASGGGISIGNLLNGMTYVRPGDAAWILGGVVLTILRGKRALDQPLPAAGLVCLPVTLVLYSSKGIHVNHLIDAASLGALAVGAAVGDARPIRGAKVLMAVATFLGLTEAIVLDAMLQKGGELTEAVNALPAGTDPVLSEQPLIPLMAGERAYMVDAYSLRQTRENSPEATADLLGRLDTCRFRAVVLIGRAEVAEDWYRNDQFGEGFREHLLSHYAFDRVIGAYAFYLPRCKEGGVASFAMPRPTDGDTIMDRGVRPSRLHAVVAALKSVLH